MGIEKIFEEDIKREDAVDEIRSVIRQSIDESAKQAINEKYKKEEELEEEEDKSDDDEEDTSDDDDDDDDDSEDDEEDDEEEDDESDKKEESSKKKVNEDEESLEEAIEVDAHRAGGRKGNDVFTINRMSDLKKLAKSRQYDYFMVKKKNGDEIDYTVDPQGNLVEM